ncbi:hypothetical protein FF38_01238 [Lucilia cuprina]|uniref:Uncharacterized protein n=1 Tax=Lucilia cuprina TaxID=7375 RepID=A0A0L0BWQ6_LUCCU|nr:hypothetical protein FF38_01238 [Lucilia cuprina]
MNTLKNYFFNIDNGDGVVADGAAGVVTYDAAEVTTSSDDEDFNEESFIKDAANNHAVKYQNLLQRNKAAKLIAKIMLTEPSLKTEYFPHPHTGANIAENITNTIKYFKLEDKSFFAISDGGSNIISGLRIANIERHECMAHSLHRFLMHDIVDNPEFVAVKTIICKLKQSYRKLSFLSEELTNIQNVSQQDNIIQILLESNEIAETCILEEQFDITIDDSINIDALPKNLTPPPTMYPKYLNSLHPNLDLLTFMVNPALSKQFATSVKI